MVGLSKIALQNKNQLGNKVFSVLSVNRAMLFGQSLRMPFVCLLLLVLFASLSVSQNTAQAALNSQISEEFHEPLKTVLFDHQFIQKSIAVGRLDHVQGVQVAGNGLVNPFGIVDPNRHITKKRYGKGYNKKVKAKKVKPTYSLGAKLPKKGYVKSYKYGNGIDFDDADLDYYRAQKGNDHYQRRVRTTYRTMCVRLRDGYYWPISFAQTKRGLKKDRAKCQKSCSDKVRLFYYPSVSTDDALANMRDLKGRRYSSLKTAFLYRTKYIKEASCKPKPWSAEAKAKHAVYAANDGKKKRLMHLAATRKAERKRVAILKGKARRLARKKRRYSKKRLRKHRRVARVYRRKKRYKK